jgi:uncharacterized membrane protein
VIRHFFNSRHAGKGSPWWTWAIAAAAMAAVGFLSAAGPRTAVSGVVPAGAGRFAQVEEIVITRCSMCHGAAPGWPGVVAAPQGILLDTPEHIRRHARLIELAALRSDAMPPGNLTEMTGAERAAIAVWIAAGKP